MFLTSGCSDVADNAQTKYSQTDGDEGNHDDKEGHHGRDSDANEHRDLGNIRITPFAAVVA
jgi:hypothetical protein